MTSRHRSTQEPFAACSQAKQKTERMLAVASRRSEPACELCVMCKTRIWFRFD